MKNLGSIWLGAFVGFLLTVVIAFLFPGIGHLVGGFIGGLVAGLIARGAGRGWRREWRRPGDR